VILLDPAARPIIAHRGASGTAPENTMLAFERGLALGADAFEFDVRVSSDGIPVVIHDPTLDRTTDATGEVNRKTARDLAKLDAGSGQGVPSVDEVLGSFPGIPAIIEVKEDQAAKPLADVIKSHGAKDRVLVGSFIHSALSCFEAYGISRCASQRETTRFWLGSRVRVALGFGGFRALSVPIRSRGVHVADRAFVQTAVRHGIPVHAWTINDFTEAKRLRALGIAGIITNWPDRMTELARS
jgi:glycerophosphoryl diester phosphodiesterase